MGSLMAGWNSLIKDPKAVKYQRNISLTKGEIDAYWKSKKKTEEENLRSIPGSEQNCQEKMYEGSGERLQRSTSLPVTDCSKITLEDPSKTGLEAFKTNTRWWTRGNWAFLNEPPVTAMEGPTYKYASMYSMKPIDRPIVRTIQE